MPGIAVEIVINAPADFVWRDVEDITTHTDWMQDAEAIRFLSDHTTGVGTRFECDTVVGPFKLTDVMEITAWQPGAAMGVRHQGLVGGTGTFTLTASGSATIFSWVERLHFRGTSAARSERASPSRSCGRCGGETSDGSRTASKPPWAEERLSQGPADA